GRRGCYLRGWATVQTRTPSGLGWGPQFTQAGPIATGSGWPLPVVSTTVAETGGDSTGWAGCRSASPRRAFVTMGHPAARRGAGVTPDDAGAPPTAAAGAAGARATMGVGA